jgi:hypothetical protein
MTLVWVAGDATAADTYEVETDLAISLSRIGSAYNPASRLSTSRIGQTASALEARD